LRAVLPIVGKYWELLRGAVVEVDRGGTISVRRAKTQNCYALSLLQWSLCSRVGGGSPAE